MNLMRTFRFRKYKKYKAQHLDLSLLPGTKFADPNVPRLLLEEDAVKPPLERVFTDKVQHEGTVKEAFEAFKANRHTQA